MRRNLNVPPIITAAVIALGLLVSAVSNDGNAAQAGAAPCPNVIITELDQGRT